MANTCAYRAGGTYEAAKAAYEAWRCSISPTGVPDVVRNPEWKELPLSAKDGWLDIFRAGHRAYRDYIRWENGMVHDVSAAETLAHLENTRRNSEVAHDVLDDEWEEDDPTYVRDIEGRAGDQWADHMK